MTRPVVLIDRLPLPAVTGGRQRMWNYLRALDALGPADLVLVGHTESSVEGVDLVARSLPGWSVSVVSGPRPRVGRASLLWRAVTGRQVSTHDQRATRRIVEEIRTQWPSPSAVVAIQAVAAEIAMEWRPSAVPLVADLWDIEHVRLARQIAVDGRPRIHPRAWWRVRRRRSDVRAWRRFHRRLMGAAHLITVCSSLDAGELEDGQSRVVVVPNGTDLSSSAVPQRREDPATPVLLYPGQMTYPPNADAAVVLARSVLPEVMSAVPQAQVRIVGRAGPEVMELHDPPHVVVTGFVDEMQPELDRAAVLVVPLRVGGGTRLKILEAFANGIPVVSTSVGAEGLDVQDGVHLLIADDPVAIAAAVVAILKDHELRRQVQQQAHALVASRYTWESIRARLSAELAMVVGAAGAES